MIKRAMILFTLCSTATADDALNSDIELVEQSSRVWVSAKPVDRVAPLYPRTDLRSGRHAWVHVAYCIDETGSPQNLSVLDSVGNERFERAAMNAVEKWQYEPSLVDGKPTWQSGNSAYITFAIEGENDGADIKFIRQFKRLNKLIMDEKTAEADELFWKMYESDGLSLYELSKLWAQRVRYEAIGGDMYKLHMALVRATASKGSWIDREDYVRLLSLRIKVEVRLEMYRTALHSYLELTEAASEKAAEVVKLQPLIEEIEALITSNQPLKIRAEVRAKNECSFCNDSWYFVPVRNDFTIANIQGELSSIDMRCDHKRFESKVSENVEWHIPDAWGSCHVQVYGNPGTTMDVLMLPANNGA